MPKPNPWDENELAYVIKLYLSMHRDAVTGQQYNKAAMIRTAQASVLRNRSRGSIESKLMNCTAAFEKVGRGDLSMRDYGYKPLGNMQAALLAEVKAVSLFMPHGEDIAAGAA